MIRRTRGLGVGRRRWWTQLGSVAGAVLLAGACSDIGADGPGAAPPPPPTVVVASPIEREVTEYLTYTGVVEASGMVELRARVQGFLDTISFDPGQRVRHGDVLFVIDKRPYEAAVERAEAEVRAQEAGLRGAENDARLARELADQRAGPEIDAIIKAARRDAVAAELARAQAELAEARLNLGYCEVTAPMDGRISRNYVDAGNLVGRGEPTLLAELVQAAPVYVSVDVSESDVLTMLRERAASGAPPAGDASAGAGQPCEMALADESAFRVPGVVDYVAPRVDAQTGTLRVRARFENADETLVPGLFARVRFPTSSHSAVLVPEAALLSDQQGRYAMIVNESDEVEVRRVRIGALDGDMRVIREGLDPGDRVITLGVLKARPGAKVTPKVQETAASDR